MSANTSHHTHIDPKDASSPKISILIPAYNEANRLAPTLTEIHTFFTDLQWPFEILVIDDGSTDSTADLVHSFAESISPEQLRLIPHPRNLGKGAAARTGLSKARAPLVLLTDADLSTPISNFHALFDAIQSGAALTIGSRALPASNVTRPQNPLRRNLGRCYNYIIRSLTRLPFRDTQCGFKLFSLPAISPILAHSQTNGFAFDIEWLLIAQKYQLPVAEIPVSWINSPDSKVHILFHPFEMLKETSQAVSRLKSLPAPTAPATSLNSQK